LTALLPYSAAIAQDEEVVFTASTDKPDNTMVLGDSLTLELKVSAGQEPPPPHLPQIDGVDVEVLPESRFVSSSISIINGKRTESKSYTVVYRYRLTPTALGKFTIPSATLVFGGKSYKTQPITVTVVKAIPQDHIILEVIPSKRMVFIDEQFRLTLKIYIDRPHCIRTYSLKLPWLRELQGFVSEDLQKFISSLRGGVKLIVENTEIPFETKTTKRNGKTYVVYSVGKMFFPTEIGVHKIPPCIFKCDYMTKYVDRYNIFGERIIKPIKSQTIIATSNDLSITVVPLPDEGKPPYFSGAVGQYKIEASISPSSVRVGDPVTLTARVYGYGNIASVGWPKLENEENLRTYEGNVETHSQREGARMVGSKKFSLIIEPQSTQVKEIPRLVFAYFDPKDVRYKTLTVGPFPIEVKPAEREPAVVIAPPNAPRTATGAVLLKRDILPIVTSPALLANQSDMLYRKPVVLWTLPLPLALIVICLLIRRRVERLRTDTAYARSRQAMSAARKRLAEARKLAASGSQKEFHAAVYRALTEFVADKLNVPPASVTAQSVREMLAYKGPDEQTVAELAACLETCEYGQFAAAEKPAQEIDETLRQASALIKKLGKSIR